MMIGQGVPLALRLGNGRESSHRAGGTRFATILVNGRASGDFIVNKLVVCGLGPQQTRPQPAPIGPSQLGNRVQQQKHQQQQQQQKRPLVQKAG
ncbi:MAG: hypothetical protein GY820_02815 [Gammaproteobacteria bacterium]|nr:hypothetical protein [Gammaproteobacteria bacterium]